MCSVIFLHPDLGIGGAERAIVDAAVAAKYKGFEVEIITNYHNPSHAFKETTNGTIKVTTVFSWLPRSTFGRFIAVWAVWKMMLAAFWIGLHRRETDVIFVDQVSSPLPILKLFGLKTIFYCHFPDLLLSSRNTWFKNAYRYPIDKLEEITTGYADTLIVNSKFTGEIFKQTFHTLRTRDLHLLYPVPNFDNLYLSPEMYRNDGQTHFPEPYLAKAKLDTVLAVRSKVMFLSANRYERKKNIGLAIEALAHLLDNWSSMVNSDTPISKSDVNLIHFGGYDSRVAENVEHFEELKNMAEKLNVSDQVVFLRSVSTEVKTLLLVASTAVIYTPDREHFGIVPVEAMYLSRPVIALNSGGPRETVLHEKTGFLCSVSDDTAKTLAQYMSSFITDPLLSEKMGRLAHEHVMEKFSNLAFQRQLSDILDISTQNKCD